MMKWLLTISFFSLVLPASSQDDANELARKLVASARTEREKVVAIFRWITENVSYNIIQPQRASFSQPTEKEEEGPLRPLNERVAETILERRTAHCDGYARLFKTLCDHAGIRAEIIQGYAKNYRDKPHPRFAVNHYWNAVYFEGEWHLLDATWASGYVTWRGDVFVRDYDDHYFLTPPEKFIADHYPEDPRWTLLPDSRVPDEFRFSPFKPRPFSKYNITSFFPSAGIVETAIGDTLVFRLETGVQPGRSISPCMSVDSTLFSYSPSWVFLRPDEEKESNYHQYTFPVQSREIQWVYLMYNEDIVLKYKVNVADRGSVRSRQ